MIPIEQKRKRGRPRKNQQPSPPPPEINNSTLETSQMYELCSAVDFFNQNGNGVNLEDIKLEDLYKYLRNPYKYLKQIRLASRYMSNKHGIIRDVLRTIKTLHSLKYHLVWSSYDDPELIKKYERDVYDLLKTLNIKKVVSDGLYEVAELGTVVLCNRQNKYIQFLDLDELRIEKQVNGKWVVEYDLAAISSSCTSVKEIKAKIDSLPPEVTLAKYNQYRSKGEDYRYVELKNCDVISIDAHRNYPYGLPFTLPAWNAILQKEIISRVERSIADRLLKQILILTAGNINDKPAPKELIDFYFKQVSNLILKKENGKHANSSNTSGTGVIAMPEIFKLTSLEIDTTFFPKELYEKIDNDIFMNLGVSPGLIYGGKANYSSSQANSDKLFRYVNNVIKEFEVVINSYIRSILPDDISCEIVFVEEKMLDKDYIKETKEFYMQTGHIIPWIEAISGKPYHFTVSMKKYQDKVLDIKDLFSPPANAYTQSSKSDNNAGRPSVDDSDNPNTIRSKTNGANNVPKPSQM